MLRDAAEKSNQLPSKALNDLKVISNGNCPHVKLDMMIGAETKNILCHVRPVMRPAQGANVGTFRIRTSWCPEHHAAHLTSVLV